MASLRRNKTLSPDGQTAKFLYTIIKQLDLKAIDWSLVAGSLEITNGHAARMRYSRFKQHMEGATTQPRSPRTGKKEKEKEGREEKEVGKKGKKRGLEEDTNDQKEAPVFPKSEPGLAGTAVRVKRECIKNEPDPEPSPPGVHIKPEPDLLPDERVAVSEAPSTVRVKQEPKPDNNSNNYHSTIDPNIWHILPHAPSNETYLQTQPTRCTPMTSQLLDPALRQSQPLPALHQSTVSLADLEVSPRSPASVLTSSPNAGPPRSSSNFITGFASGQQSALAASRAAGNTTSVEIKDEPLSDVDWMITGLTSDGMVKSELLEI